MTNAYQTAYDQSINAPNEFWGEAAEKISWVKRWDKVLDDSNPPFYRWFTGGQLNTCYNALDVHVENGRGDQAALIYDSPVTDTIKTYTYSELRDEVAQFAGALKTQGVEKGDRVIIYMPMIAEAAIAMLACARIGAVHSVVFGGFAANELATRINDAKPKVIVSASCGIEIKKVIPYKPLLDGAIDMAAFKPKACIILQRPMETAQMVAGRDIDWQEAIARSEPADCTTVEATDPLYILYTSGTTGEPKGVVRDNGGHAVALKWTMKNIYNVEAGDVYWAASDVGWVVGHSYIVYGPLLAGCTTILYEGKPVFTPDAGAFWRVISQHKVKAMFTAPTAFRAIKQQDPGAELIKKIRPVQLQNPFPGRRAHRSRHPQVGSNQFRCAGHRPLVANRDRMGHLRQLHGHSRVPCQRGLSHQARARLEPAGHRSGNPRAGQDRRYRRPGGQTASAARHPADAVAERQTLC
jgi:propionyl-CoA synthetase